MLESCDVMTTLGSRIHNLFVDPTKSMRKTIYRTSDTGVTRIEIKVYGGKVRKCQWYLNQFENIKYCLRGCKFYRCSFEDQWKNLVDKIYDKQVTMVYFEEDRFFAYCHWWNSLTGKMQGGSQRNVAKKDLASLISNYSFNGVKTKVFYIGNEKTIIEEFKRVENNITLIPGPRGGLYPKVRSRISPEEVGLVNYRGFHIGWTNKTMEKTSSALAAIRKISTGLELQEITDLSVSHYRAGHSILNTNTKYKVIAKGRLMYRDRECTVIEVLDEEDQLIKIRCGPILSEVMEDKIQTFVIQTGKIIRTSYQTRDIEIIR